MGLPQNLHEDLAGIQSLAASVMEQVRARLYVELRFLDRALFGLQPTPVLTFPTLGSDRNHLFYNPAYVDRALDRRKERVVPRHFAHGAALCVPSPLCGAKHQPHFVGYRCGCGRRSRYHRVSDAMPYEYVRTGGSGNSLPFCGNMCRSSRPNGFMPF